MIIFDEKLYAEELLRKGFKTKNKNVYELNILCKYFFYEGLLGENEVKKKLIKFCEKYVEYFDIDEWYKIINNTIRSAKRGTLKTGKEVNITQKELDTILTIEGLREQKVAFTLLVLYKFYECNKFNVVIEDIYRLSEVTTINRKTKLQILYKLTQAKLIDIDMRGRRWVKFTCDHSDNVISIRNFDNFIWEYLKFVGQGKFKRCMECRVIIKDTNGNKKYCQLCQRKVLNKQVRTNMKKYRGKNML